MGKWLASALSVADEVSFVFDGINATIHSMWWHRQRLLAFYDTFIKDYRGSQVSAHWFFYDRTGEREVGDTNGWCPSAAAACCETARQTTTLMTVFLRLMQPAVKIACQCDAAEDSYSLSVTSPNTHWKLHMRYWTYARTSGTLYKLKFKIKYRYQGTLK